MDFVEAQPNSEIIHGAIRGNLIKWDKPNKCHIGCGEWRYKKEANCFFATGQIGALKTRLRAKYIILDGLFYFFGGRSRFYIVPSFIVGSGGRVASEWLDGWAIQQSSSTTARGAATMAFDNLKLSAALKLIVAINLHSLTNTITWAAIRNNDPTAIK